jgi:hypothetical protein
MISTHKKALKKKKLFMVPLLIVLLIGVFFVTRGVDPHTSELAFIEHSQTRSGSVVPASCNSAPPTSHFLNDCTAICPATGAAYDPYLDPGACPTAAPTAAISTDVTNVDYGGSAFISWSSTAATGCTAGGSWVGALGISGMQAKTNITSPKTYTLYCSGGTGNSSTVSATVTPCPLVSPVWDGAACTGVSGQPTASLVAVPQHASYNSNVTLIWNSTNASGCTASGSWSGAKNSSGSLVLTALTTSGVYNLLCSNGSGNSPAVNVAVTVCPQATPFWNGASCVTSTTAVTLELTALPSTVSYGKNSTLRWKPTRATSCSATGSWGGSLLATGGSTSTGALTSTRTYNASCSNAGGTTPLQSVTVTTCPIATPTWNGSVCLPESGTLTPSSCTIPTGSGSCTTNVAWQTTDVPGSITVRRTYAGYTTMASGPIGNSSFVFPYSATPYVIDLYSVGTGNVLATAGYTASCTVGGYDSLGHVCASPSGFSYITGNYYGPGQLTFMCNYSNAYKVRRDGAIVSSAAPNTYTSGTLINLPISTSGTYQIECLHGDYGTLLQPWLFSTTPPAPIISLIASPRTITKNTETNLNWAVQFPIASCALTAKAVCSNDICTADQLAAETVLNARLASENTDLSDPNGVRSIATAIKTIVPSHMNTDYKALGKKTFQISNSTDFTITCGAQKSTARVRVTLSNEQ